MGKRDTVITLEELEAALGREAREYGGPPAGGKTAQEWADERGVSRRTAQTRISDAKGHGMVEVKKFRRVGINGSKHFSAHYCFNLKAAQGRKRDPSP